MRECAGGLRDEGGGGVWVVVISSGMSRARVSWGCVGGVRGRLGAGVGVGLF